MSNCFIPTHSLYLTNHSPPPPPPHTHTLCTQVSLETGPSQVASEYYTSEEMVQFRKTKKKRKLRKKEKVKADDLLPLGNETAPGMRDHGSRR